MTRSRASAKQAGSSFERDIADYFKVNGYPFADRRVTTGAKDRGDIGGVHLGAHRLVIECKNYAGKLEASTWVREAQQEATNDGALAGLVIAKRRGTTNPAEQYVLTTVQDLTNLLNAAKEQA